MDGSSDQSLLKCLNVVYSATDQIKQTNKDNEEVGFDNCLISKSVSKSLNLIIVCAGDTEPSRTANYEYEYSKD